VIDAPNRVSKYSAVGVSASGVYNTTLVAAVVAYFLALYYFRIGSDAEKLDFHDFGDIYTWAYAARIGLNPYTPDGVIPLAKQLGFQAMTANYPPPFVLAIEPVCDELLIVGNSPHTYMDRSRAQDCFWSPMSDDPVAVIYSASLWGGLIFPLGSDGSSRTFA